MIQKGGLYQKFDPTNSNLLFIYKIFIRNMNFTQTAKKPAFELFRALAITMVFLGHFVTSLPQNDYPVIQLIIIPFSYYGVPLFFIISGFLLSASFESILRKRSSISLVIRDFLYRRVLRIYPAYVVSLVILSIYYQVDVSDFFVHLFNVHNFFPGSNRSINPVYWSLAVEFQWYIIAPLIFYCFMKTEIKMHIILLLVLILVSLFIRYDILADYVSRVMDFNELIRMGQDQLIIHVFNFIIGVFIYHHRTSPNNS